jgi:hypothetical protein
MKLLEELNDSNSPAFCEGRFGNSARYSKSTTWLMCKGGLANYVALYSFPGYGVNQDLSFGAAPRWKPHPQKRRDYVQFDDSVCAARINFRISPILAVDTIVCSAVAATVFGSFCGGWLSTRLTITNRRDGITITTCTPAPLAASVPANYGCAQNCFLFITVQVWVGANYVVARQ